MLRIHEEKLDIYQLAEIRKEVTNGHPEFRRNNARQYYEAVKLFVSVRKRKRSGRQAEWQHRSGSHTGRVPTSEPTHSLNDQKDARFYFSQALALTPIEVAVGALLSEWIPKAFGDWRYVIGGAAGLVVMIGVRAVPKNRFRFEVPKLSEETLKKLANVITAFFMAAVAILLFNRFNGTHFTRTRLAGIALVTIALALPLLAAIYYQLSAHHKELNDLAEDFDQIDHEIGVAESLLHEMDLVLAGVPVPEGGEPEPVPEPAVHGEAVGVPNRALGILLPFLIFAALWIGMAVAGVRPALACQPVDVLEDWDTSGSVDPAAIEAIRREIQAQVAQHPCLQSVGIRGFATVNDVLSAPFVKKTPPQKGSFDEEAVCGEKDFSYNMYEDERREYDRKCQGKRDAFAGKEAQKLGAFSEALAAEVGKLNFKRKSPQSCIYQDVSHALAEAPSVKPIIVSDLKEECSTSPKVIQPLFGAKGGARPIVIVVPSVGDGDPIGAMEKRIRALRERAPQVLIIPYNQANALGSMLQGKKGN